MGCQPRLRDVLIGPCVHSDAASKAAAAGKLHMGGTTDARSVMRAAAPQANGGIPPQLWGQFGQPQDKEGSSSSTGHPLSGAFPTSLWSADSYSNGTNGTHQMW